MDYCRNILEIRKKGIFSSQELTLLKAGQYFRCQWYMGRATFYKNDSSM